MCGHYPSSEQKRPEAEVKETDPTWSQFFPVTTPAGWQGLWKQIQDRLWRLSVLSNWYSTPITCVILNFLGSIFSSSNVFGLSIAGGALFKSTDICWKCLFILSILLHLTFTKQSALFFSAAVNHSQHTSWNLWYSFFQSKGGFCFFFSLFCLNFSGCRSGLWFAPRFYISLYTLKSVSTYLF